MVTHQQQNELVVGPKTTLWILAICAVLCVIAGVLASRSHEANTAQGVDQIYPGAANQGQVRTWSPQAPRGQMYELREQPGAGNTSPGGNASGASSVMK